MPVIAQHGMIMFTIIIMFQLLKQFLTHERKMKDENEKISRSSSIRNILIPFPTQNEISEFI
ncbi:hypothetical protein SAMN05518672_105102 [Chitinophaga sp. CF118]|nr:hypothetical protein SAMN05518672_105102 [Chitinophaga sp. CF118]